ncbi:hypothetical protein AAC387_Pa07g1367 [Persea americana]
MSNTEQRASDIRIWILSLLFLFFIVTGGAFLFMYVTYTETDNTAWYPIAGTVLVAIPWIFWLLTFVYRCCIKVEEGGRAGGPIAFSNKASLGKQAGGASGRSGSSASRSESMQGGAPETTRQVGVEPQEQKASQIEGRGSNNSNESDKPLALSS